MEDVRYTSVARFTALTERGVRCHVEHGWVARIWRWPVTGAGKPADQVKIPADLCPISRARVFLRTLRAFVLKQDWEKGLRDKNAQDAVWIATKKTVEEFLVDFQEEYQTSELESCDSDSVEFWSWFTT